MIDCENVLGFIIKVETLEDKYSLLKGGKATESQGLVSEQEISQGPDALVPSFRQLLSELQGVNLKTRRDQMITAVKRTMKLMGLAEEAWAQEALKTL